MKKIIITVLFLLCLLTAKAVFAQAALYDDFQSYSAGRFQNSGLWDIQEKSETGGSISIESSGNNQFIKNEIVYKTGYEKSDSFLQSAALGGADNWMLSTRVCVPNESQGSLHVVLRGSGEASSNTMYLCTITRSKITYLPYCGNSVSETLSGSSWLQLDIHINWKTGEIKIYRGGSLKRTDNNYRSASAGKYNTFQTGSFSLRMYTTVPKTNGYRAISYYDDIYCCEDLSSSEDISVSSPFFTLNLNDRVIPVNTIRKGSLNGKFFCRNYDGADRNILIVSAVFHGKELVKSAILSAVTGKSNMFDLQLPTESLSSGEEMKLFIWSDMQPLTLPQTYSVSAYTRPYAEEIKSYYCSAASSGKHPRILADSSDFDVLRNKFRSDPQINEWCNTVIENADSVLSQPPCQYIILDNKRLLNQCRLALDRILRLGMAYQLTGREKYSDRAWTELEAAGNFPDWNPLHYLDTAEMTAAFAIGYDWMYDAFDGTCVKNGRTVTQREFLEQAILNFGVTNGQKAYRGTLENNWGWFTTATHNWNAVCNGGMTMGAIAIADVYPDISFEVLEGAIKSLEIMLPSFAPDGAWFEGPGYWDYAVKYLTFMLGTLESALGTDFGLSTYPGLSETAEFIYQASGPCGSNNFHDSGSSQVNAPEVFWLADKFQSSAAQAARLFWINQYNQQINPLDLLYFNDRPVDSSIDYPLDKYYRGVELVSMRSGWTDKNDTFLSFHAGKAVLNHSHIDCGSFVFDSQGIRWALDLGSDNLTYTTHYGDSRYEVYRIRAEGHNTLVIDPDLSAGQNLDADTKITKFEQNNEASFAIMDLSSAYKEKAYQVTRGLRLTDARQSLLIRDEIDLKESGDIYWFMHTKASVKIEGDTAILTQNGKQMRLRFSSNSQSAQMYTTAASPLPSSPNPSGQASNAGTTRIVIKLHGRGRINLSVKLSPVAIQNLDDIPLDEWSLGN